MIKNKFKTIALATMLLSTSLMAKHSTSYHDADSLIAVEGGYSRIDSEINDLTGSAYSRKGDDLYNIGLKIGAQTQHYRIFLSANYFNDNSNNYDYIATYGFTFDYKFNISSQTNMFVGINSGLANMKFIHAGESIPRILSNPYIGGNTGFNFSIGKNTDFELGARYINIQASNLKNNKNYVLNDMLSYYVSFIFKFKMN